MACLFSTFEPNFSSKSSQNSKRLKPVNQKVVLDVLVTNLVTLSCSKRKSYSKVPVHFSMLLLNIVMYILQHFYCVDKNKIIKNNAILL
jgi:hypothetical protein